MRECLRCGTEMKENCGIKVEGWRSGYLVLTDVEHILFSSSLDSPKVAICPNCGEVSIYLENASKLNMKK